MSQREHTDKSLLEASSTHGTAEIANIGPKTKLTEAVTSQEDAVISDDKPNNATRHNKTDLIDVVASTEKTGVSGACRNQQYTGIGSPKIVHGEYADSSAQAKGTAVHSFNTLCNKDENDHGVTEGKEDDNVPENIEPAVVCVNKGGNELNTVFLGSLGAHSPSTFGPDRVGVNALDDSENSNGHNMWRGARLRSGKRTTNTTNSGSCQTAASDCVDGADNRSINKNRTIPGCSLLSGDAAARDRKIQDALEYYAIERSASSYPCIDPIEPSQRPWNELRSCKTIDYHGEDLTVGDVIEVETQGCGDNSIADIREIRDLGDDRYLLLVSWYCSKKEMHDSGCKNKKEWPRSHSHMISTHMQIIMWDTTNCKVSTEDSSKFSPGRILDWYHKPVLIRRYEFDD